jgi:hypothetical protein
VEAVLEFATLRGLEMLCCSLVVAAHVSEVCWNTLYMQQVPVAEGWPFAHWSEDNAVVSIAAAVSRMVLHGEK